MALLSRIASGMILGVQMMGLLILGLIFIFAPEMAYNLGLGMFRFKTALAG